MAAENLNDLVTFVAVAEERSFTRAAPPQRFPIGAEPDGPGPRGASWRTPFELDHAQRIADPGR